MNTGLTATKMWESANRRALIQGGEKQAVARDDGRAILQSHSVAKGHPTLTYIASLGAYERDSLRAGCSSAGNTGPERHRIGRPRQD